MSERLTYKELLTADLDEIRQFGAGLCVRPGSEASDLLWRINAVSMALIGPGSVDFDTGVKALRRLVRELGALQ